MEHFKNKITLGTFDLMKGVAMLFFIVGHMMEYYPIEDCAALTVLRKLISPAISGVTFFFLLAGYAFRRKSVKKTLKQTAKNFLIPYLWVFGFTIVLTPIIDYAVTHDLAFSLNDTRQYLVAFLLGVPMRQSIFGVYTAKTIGYAIYFLLALFIALNVLNLILKIGDERMQYLLVFLCLGAGRMLKYMGFYFYCISVGLSAVIFCYMGYQFNKYDVIHKVWEYKWILPGLLFVVVTALIGGWYGISFVEGSPDFLLGVISGMAITALLFFVSIPIGNLEWKVMEPLKKLGTYSYWAMCIHAVDMFAAAEFWHTWVNSMKDHILRAFCMDLAVKLVVIFCVCFVLKRIQKMKYRRKMKDVLQSVS